MNFIKNMNIIQEACNQFVEPHPCQYNFPLEINPLLKHYPHLRLETQEVVLTSSLSQDTSLHVSKIHMVLNKRNAENCLVYLHGLSSYCLEGKFLIPHLADSLSLCLFDSRAHGKNKQKLVTYGLLQSEELHDILKHLVKKGFKNIILWGRSMGAVTCLKLLNRIKGCQMIQNVRYVVADAPFCSFKTIATQIVSRRAHLPEFISGVFAQAFVQKIKQKHGIDLNLLDLEQLSTVVPVNILYSSKDELMSQKHIENIIKNNWHNFQVNDVQVRHNEERPNWIISKLILKIREKLTRCKRIVPFFSNQKKRGLSITKFCQEQILLPLTPGTISTSQVREDHFNKLAKKNITKRQIRSQLYGQYKQNRDYKQNREYTEHSQYRQRKEARSGQFSFKANLELGGSKVDLVSNRLVHKARDRKITVSQFFIQG